MGNRRIKEAPGDQDDRRIKKKRHQPFGRCFFSGVKYTSLKRTICVHLSDIQVAILCSKSDIYINLRTAKPTGQGGSKMTKRELTEAIINDMVSKNPTQENSIKLEWTRWLMKQHKFKLEEILMKRTSWN